MKKKLLVIMMLMVTMPLCAVEEDTDVSDTELQGVNNCNEQRSSETADGEGRVVGSQESLTEASAVPVGSQSNAESGEEGEEGLGVPPNEETVPGAAQQEEPASAASSQESAVPTQAEQQLQAGSPGSSKEQVAPEAAVVLGLSSQGAAVPGQTGDASLQQNAQQATAANSGALGEQRGGKKGSSPRWLRSLFLRKKIMFGGALGAMLLAVRGANGRVRKARKMGDRRAWWRVITSRIQRAETHKKAEELTA